MLKSPIVGEVIGVKVEPASTSWLNGRVIKLPAKDVCLLYTYTWGALILSQGSFFLQWAAVSGEMQNKSKS